MTYNVELAELPAQHVALVRGKVRHEGIAGFLGSAFSQVAEAVAKQGLQIAGPPFGRYRLIDDGGWDIEAGFPVSGPIEVAGPVEPDVLPAGTAARTMHVGPYDKVAQAYEAAMAFVSEQGYRPTGDPWESYLDGPEVAEPRTELFVPCEPAQRH